MEVSIGISCLTLFWIIACHHLALEAAGGGDCGLDWGSLQGC